VKRNVDVTITPASSGWQGGWSVTDANGNSIDNHLAVSGVNISSGPTNVVYLTSGRIQGGVAPTFSLASQAHSTSIQQCVTADPSGLPLTKTTSC
jgi:type IV fimbrial biogenesis protein FimT